MIRLRFRLRTLLIEVALWSVAMAIVVLEGDYDSAPWFVLLIVLPLTWTMIKADSRPPGEGRPSVRQLATTFVKVLAVISLIIISVMIIVPILFPDSIR
jgi:hypothetical protein